MDRQTDRQTDRQRDNQTDIVVHRSDQKIPKSVTESGIIWGEKSIDVLPKEKTHNFFFSELKGEKKIKNTFNVSILLFKSIVNGI